MLIGTGAHYSCQILTHFYILNRFLEKKKFLDIKVHLNPTSGRLVVPWGRADGRRFRSVDGRDEANSRFQQLYELPSKKYLTCSEYIMTYKKSVRLADTKDPQATKATLINNKASIAFQVPPVLDIQEYVRTWNQCHHAPCSGNVYQKAIFLTS